MGFIGFIGFRGFRVYRVCRACRVYRFIGFRVEKRKFSLTRPYKTIPRMNPKPFQGSAFTSNNPQSLNSANSSSGNYSVVAVGNLQLQVVLLAAGTWLDVENR